jgi:hypothetical protein
MMEANYLTPLDPWFQSEVIDNAKLLPIGRPPDPPPNASSRKKGIQEQLQSAQPSMSSSLSHVDVFADPEAWWEAVSTSKVHHLQQFFSSLYDSQHQNYFTDLIQEDADFLSHYAHLNHSQSGKFLMAIPKSPATTFSPEQFQHALSHRLHLQLYNRDKPFSCVCSSSPPVDFFGNHLLNCHKGIEVRIRHNALVDSIADLVRQAGLNAETEPSNSHLIGEEGEQLRPDITIFHSPLHDGCDVHLDVTIRGALPKESLSSFYKRCESSKNTKYVASATATKTKFIPIVFEVNGAMSPQTVSLIHSLILKKSNRLQDFIPLSTLTHHWFTRLSTVLARNNGSLLHRRLDNVISRTTQSPSLTDLSYSTHRDLEIPQGSLGSLAFFKG